MQLHLKDIALLESLKSYFKVGKVFVRKTADVASFEVYSIGSILDKVIPHFYRYPLLTQKRADYELFKMVAEKMISKVHLTENGLEEIIAIKASSNLGLSKKLKEAFPNIQPVPRPLVTNQKNLDPY